MQTSARYTGNQGCTEDLKSKKAILADLMDSKAQEALVQSRFQRAALIEFPNISSVRKEECANRFTHSAIGRRTAAD